MSTILLQARSVLEQNGYATHSSRPDVESFSFEDSSLLGHLFVLPSVEVILNTWEERQDGFLRQSSQRLMSDPFKAWNCYTVFLTHEPVSKDSVSDLFVIEENFRGTRKIVRAGIHTSSEVESALSPLLPLRRILQLTPEDVKGRLVSRLSSINSTLANLLTDTPTQRIAAALIDSE